MPMRLLTATALFVGTAHAKPPVEPTPVAMARPVLDACRVTGNIVVTEGGGKSPSTISCSIDLRGAEISLPILFATTEGESCSAVGERVVEMERAGCRFRSLADETVETWFSLPTLEGA